jgi:polysaccharide pyruvyl transferase WcaK-like protein
VLNIAAGSCYPWKLQPQSIENPNDVQYLKAILGYCRVTTVRDVLAQSLSTSLGFHTPLIPCSAFVAHEGLVRRPARKKTIVLNYMHQGGHYDWGQNIDAMRWQHTMRSLVQRLKLRHDVVWLCHNEREYHLAGTIDSELKRIWPKNTQEYVSLLGEVDVALCNRLHASVVLAGLGVPSIAVGTDTRMLMVEALGLPAYYVEETNVDELEQQLEWMLCNSHVQRERLVSLKTDTFSQYVQIIKETIA